MRWSKGHLLRETRVCIPSFPLVPHAKTGWEDTLKLTTGNESLHETSSDNGIRVVNFAEESVQV
jgi:hypothetical protein